MIVRRESRRGERLVVFVVRPEDAAAAVQAANKVKAKTVELSANAGGKIEVTVSPDAEAAVERAVAASELRKADGVKEEAVLQRLTEVGPLMPVDANKRRMPD